MLYRRLQIFIENRLRVFNSRNHYCETLEKFSLDIHCRINRYLLLSISSGSTSPTTQLYHTDGLPLFSTIPTRPLLRQLTNWTYSHYPPNPLINLIICYLYLDPRPHWPSSSWRGWPSGQRIHPLLHHHRLLSLTCIRPKNLLSFLNCYRVEQSMVKPNPQQT